MITIQDILKGVNGSQRNPYFQGKDTEVVRGMTSMMSDDKKSIEHIDQADFFTLAHESGHVFFEDNRMLLVTVEDAPEQVIEVFGVDFLEN